MSVSRHAVGGLEFEFDKGWKVGKPDEWAYYRKQFISMWDGIRAVDLLAVDPEGTLWLIEVKNFLLHPRRDEEPFGLVVGKKTFGTLAMLLPARLHAGNEGERGLAQGALTADRLRVVFHLEQPERHSKLFPRAFDPADVQAQLRKRIHPMDPHPRVVDSRTPHLPWKVRRARQGASQGA